MLNVEYRFRREFTGEVSKEAILCELLLGSEVIGFSEVYLIAGGEDLAGYLDQSDMYCNWIPQDAMFSIEFDGVTGLSHNIGYIHNIVIYEDWRGKGFAGFFLEQVEEITRNNGMENIILQPCPLERDNPDAYFSTVEALIEFYVKKGYAPYETKGFMRNPYYFKSLK